MTEKLNVLFKEWKKKDVEYEKEFIKDGIITSSLWYGNSKEKKIFFVLKEPSVELKEQDKPPRFIDKDTWKLIVGSQSLCELFREGCKGVGWSFTTLGRLAYGLQNVTKDDFPKFQKTNDKDENKQRNLDKAFLRSSIMNLKKTCGGTNCNETKLKDYAEKYKDEIEKEINIINPEIAVCCGTYWILERLFNLKKVRESLYVYESDKFKNMLFLKTSHPQAGRWKNNKGDILKGASEKYKDLINDYQEYLKCKG